jgi:hypothetical protein
MAPIILYSFESIKFCYYNGDYVFVEREKFSNMNRKEGYGFVVAVHSPENTGDPPTKYVRYEIDYAVHIYVP